MESELSKATQLGPRIAVVPLESSGVKWWGFPEMLTSPGDPGGKGALSSHHHSVCTLGPVPSDQRQELPQGKFGGDNGENTPESDCRYTHLRSLGMASQGDRDVSERLSLKRRERMA